MRGGSYRHELGLPLVLGVVNPVHGDSGLKLRRLPESWGVASLQGLRPIGLSGSA